MLCLPLLTSLQRVVALRASPLDHIFMELSSTCQGESALLFSLRQFLREGLLPAPGLRLSLRIEPIYVELLAYLLLRGHRFVGPSHMAG
jgi:hypothetical protein